MLGGELSSAKNRSPVQIQLLKKGDSYLVSLTRCLAEPMLSLKTDCCGSAKQSCLRVQGRPVGWHSQGMVHTHSFISPGFEQRKVDGIRIQHSSAQALQRAAPA